MSKTVVIVDENDNFIRLEEKIKAHKEGLLHRAFSLLIFNSNGEMLLQRRALSKYHSPGLWTNSCCSHPSLNDEIENNIINRLEEEMGMSCDNIKEIFKFKYFKKFDNGLTENELDRVFVGFSDVDPVLNLDEADDFKWISPKLLYSSIKKDPETYTFWFKEILRHPDFKTYLYENRFI